MNIDWVDKWMEVPLARGGEKKLQGILVNTKECEVITLGKLLNMWEQGAVQHCLLLNAEQQQELGQCPQEMQDLVSRFSTIFEEPKACPQKGHLTTLFL
jgi:hypothetical protein